VIAPLDLGLRLQRGDDLNLWRIITYDKGTWVMRMLARRLGEENFAVLLRNLANGANGRRLTNDDLRIAAAKLLPAKDPDPDLELFFDTWVYGTGIPQLHLVRAPGRNREYILRMSGVEPNFTVDVPLVRREAGKPDSVLWVRATPPETTFSESGVGSITVSLPDERDFLHTRD
jgi:hypothetical protein